MPHYRTMLTSENLMASDLWSEKDQKYLERDVQIVEVKKGEVVGEKGRKKGMPFATLLSKNTGQRIPKPLGLNATNCRTISSIAGSPNVEKWKGCWITLYVTKTDAGREEVDCIRIRPKVAQPPGKPASEPAPSMPTEPAPQDGALDDADKRAIEVAEREENNR